MKRIICLRWFVRNDTTGVDLFKQAHQNPLPVHWTHSGNVARKLDHLIESKMILKLY
jgi:hypothetical protein